MPDQSSRGDIVDIGIDAEIGPAVDVEGVQGDEDRRILPVLDLIEFDRFALLVLRQLPRANGYRVDRSAKDVLVILWIGDPASPRGVEDSVCPSLDTERESILINVSGSSPEAPNIAIAEIDVVEEDNDLGRGDKRALEFYMHEGGAIEIAEVLAGEKIQFVGRKGEHMIKTVVESGVLPSCDMTISPMLGEELDC